MSLSLMTASLDSCNVWKVLSGHLSLQGNTCKIGIGVFQIVKGAAGNAAW